MIGLALLALSGSVVTPPCAIPAGMKSAPPVFFLERVPPAEGDSLVMVRLCISPPKGGLGSYSVTLNYDSTQMRARRMDVTGGGLQVANPDVPGTVRIAGAAPTGFRAGTLGTIVFRPRKGTALGRIRLTLTEANSPSGTSVLPGLSVAGYPASDRTLGAVAGATNAVNAAQASVIPRIDSLTPRSTRLDDEGVIEIAIYGHGFAPQGNVVLFDAATVDGVASERGGTIIRFLAPTYIPAHGGTQGRRVTAGRYLIKVRTPGGTSNAVSFTARESER